MKSQHLIKKRKKKGIETPTQTSTLMLISRLLLGNILNVRWFEYILRPKTDEICTQYYDRVWYRCKCKLGKDGNFA